MSHLVKDLNAATEAYKRSNDAHYKLLDKVGRCIEELERENALLRKALEPFAEIEVPDGLNTGAWAARCVHSDRAIDVYSVLLARAALARIPEAK